MNDRSLTVWAITTIGVVSLLGAIFLGGLVIVRLHSGEDIPPGVAAFLAGLALAATNSMALLAPSPLSKRSGVDDATTITVPEGSIEVEAT